MAERVLLLLKDNGDGTKTVANAIVVDCDDIVDRADTGAPAGPGWTRDRKGNWQAPPAPRADDSDDETLEED